MPQVLHLLREDHHNLAALLNILQAQLEAFEAGGVPDYDIMEGVLDYCLSYADECHHPREDLIYARLRALGGVTAETGSDLQGEHAELTSLTKSAAATVREVRAQGSVPREKLTGVLRDFLAAYRRHMEQEESFFFPAALESLGADDWAAIDARIRRRDDPVFGAKVEKRFQALRDYLHTLDRIAREG